MAQAAAFKIDLLQIHSAVILSTVGDTLDHIHRTRSIDLCFCHSIHLSSRNTSKRLRYRESLPLVSELLKVALVETSARIIL